jgi:uncharacterized protein (DUF1501 family)
MTTRRLFLKSSGLAMVAFGVAPKFLVRSAYAGDNARKKILVTIFQRGACDGLNTVIPIGEETYRKVRPSIAVSPDKALDLGDGFFAFHPALEPLLPLWKEKSLAVVHAIGSPDPTRSHFDAQDFMESGTPGLKSTDDGWMNRHLQANPDAKATPFRAVSLTPTVPRSLAGKVPALAMANLQSFGIRGANVANATDSARLVARGFEDMYEGAVHDALHGTGKEAFDAMEFLKKSDPARYQPENGAQYPRGKYGDGLRQIAQLIKADVGVEMAFAETGGWDHHAAEGAEQGQIAQKLRELGGALAAFHKDMGDRMADIVVVTMTEFGRTVRENGNRGTDHGHASVSFVMGGPVDGGKVHGKWPGLRDGDLYEGRDLAVTTDFRDLLAEVLARHSGGRDLKSVFPNYQASEKKFPGVIRT